MTTAQTKQILQALSTTSSSPAQQIDQIAQIRNWFQPKQDSEAYAHIQAYLSGTLDLSRAVANLTSPIDAALATASHADDVEARWWDLWTSILHSSKRVSYTDEEPKHTSLATLITALKDHPDPHPNTLSSTAWPSLPWFAAAVREAYNDAPVDDYDDDHDQGGPESSITPIIALEAAAWANLNALLARLTAARTLDLATYYALWALRAALETDHGHDGGPAAMFKYDARVPAAAAWVLCAGHELLRREVDLSPAQPRQGNPAKGGDLWTGVAGFGRERWAFWRERFGVVAGLEGVREGTREVACRAVREMERVEREVGV